MSMVFFPSSLRKRYVSLDTPDLVTVSTGPGPSPEVFMRRMVTSPSWSLASQVNLTGSPRETLKSLLVKVTPAKAWVMMQEMAVVRVTEGILADGFFFLSAFLFFFFFFLVGL